MRSFRNNKILKFIVGLIRFLIYFFLICVIFVVVTQKVSGNSIAIGGIRIFNVISGSMEPDYEKGDILVVKQTDPEQLKVGQVIVYCGKEGQVDGKIVTHQIVRIEKHNGEKIFYTKGISNMIEDPEVKADQIYGVVKHKMIVLSFINKLMYNIYFFYFILIIPTGIIIFLEIKNIREKMREEDDE